MKTTSSRPAALSASEPGEGVPAGRLVVLGVLLMATLLALLALVGRPRVSLRVPSAPGADRLVVLPVRNAAADPDLEPLCRSLTGALERGIRARGVPGVVLVRPEAAAMFTARATPPEAAAHLLDARYVVEGSLDRDGDAVVAAFQIVRLADRRRLWAARYRALSPADLERRVVGEVLRAIGAPEARPRPGLLTADPGFR